MPPLSDVMQTFMFASLGLGGLAYLVSSFRRGRDEASSATISLLKEEIAALKLKVATLETAEAGHTAENRELRNKVGRLQQENDQLRALVMYEKLPDGLRTALDGLRSELGEQLENIEARIVGGLMVMGTQLTQIVKESPEG